MHLSYAYKAIYVAYHDIKDKAFIQGVTEAEIATFCNLVKTAEQSMFSLDLEAIKPAIENPSRWQYLCTLHLNRLLRYAWLFAKCTPPSNRHPDDHYDSIQRRYRREWTEMNEAVDWVYSFVELLSTCEKLSIGSAESMHNDPNCVDQIDAPSVPDRRKKRDSTADDIAVQDDDKAKQH